MFNSNFTGISFRRIGWCIALVIFAVLVLPWSRFYFTDLGIRWLYILLFSFSLSAILTPVMRLVALKLKIVDVPGGRKIHEKSTPLLGGVAIVVAFIAAILANMVLEREVVLLLWGGAVVALVGLADDWRGVSARLKLFAQIFVVLVLIYFGIVLNLFPQTMWGYWLNVLFTILWIIGITNAMNFIDGMDGLAAGIGAIIAMFMGIVAFQTDQPFMAWLAIAMMGSCLGFLPFNFGLKRPASIYLGDTGSTFIGFMLAALAIKGNWADNSRIVSFSAPVLIFWILIYDMAYITIERIVTCKVKSLKQWIDYVGTDHIHHRLYSLLGDKRKAVLFIYFLCATLGISAITLRYARPIDGVLLVVQAFLITIIVSIAEYSGRNR
ncbi:MAG: undecaprenyl/decaprenyl-phosphate alpha-N-acetylglucosaminyl 1-phosphate transferase [Desulfobacteraceae bacterium]|nr:undecaprenyl/decaprenyl-phosphate alpha-N-acetylglucosaminyl 1-phosphate transferase [Pseudomonadota bacterium]MBU4463309.1 undecaprenyl/decaprenyl-phosphate alpha-N-acetylglucosaminyl 1-phosphate transferase [Pseudomonadota bacterium]MCG2754085.1 undecaprenyl/decaprenyl-phosphate alpha-N-acetylglucosaminyl 1-phosphate transferase [Desulfobacteraceae bacterium]